jgi:hypothetical protein
MKRKHMLNIVFITILVGSIIYLQKSTNKFEEELLQDSKFAIGTFVKFGYGYKSGGRNYQYSYYNENFGRIRPMTDRRDMSKLEQRNVLKGDQFLVLYNKGGESIYFDRPINDSTDFIRYIREFEEMRKMKK